MSDFYELGVGLFLIIGIVMLGTVILAIAIWWKIFAKAGYGGAMGLLMFVPIANLVVLLMLAFGEWPIHRELNALRAQLMPRGPQGYGQQPPRYPGY